MSCLLKKVIFATNRQQAHGLLDQVTSGYVVLHDMTCPAVTWGNVSLCYLGKEILFFIKQVKRRLFISSHEEFLCSVGRSSKWQVVCCSDYLSANSRESKPHMNHVLLLFTSWHVLYKSNLIYSTIHTENKILMFYKEV